MKLCSQIKFCFKMKLLSNEESTKKSVNDHTGFHKLLMTYIKSTEYKKLDKDQTKNKVKLAELVLEQFSKFSKSQDKTFQECYQDVFDALMKVVRAKQVAGSCFLEVLRCKEDLDAHLSSVAFKYRVAIAIGYLSTGDFHSMLCYVLDGKT
jgi:hypothetical protein